MMNDKQRVVAKLEGRELSLMAEECYQLENEIMERADELPRAGQDCNCDICNREVYSYVHEGSSFDEIIKLCLKCGGYVSG